jgi:hypothetical protein
LSGRAADDRPGGSVLTLVLAGAATALFGWVGGLPFLLGPVVGVAGVVGSSLLRTRPRVGASFGPWPALLALAALAVTAPPVSSAELFGGLATLAVLVWLADDPSRPSGGGRRAGLTIGSCAVGVAVAWSLLAVAPRPTGAVGVAGALLVVVLLVVAYLLVREASPRPRPGANA